MDDELLAALKSLSDASRLRLVGLLADGRAMSVTDLASRLELTPGTVVHHLKRLRVAGLVSSEAKPPHVMYSLRRERLAEIGAALDAVSRERAGLAPSAPLAAPAWATPAVARVLAGFLEDDRLSSIPAQHVKRLVVLRWLAEEVLEPERDYPEKELNALLALRHPDVASLRRYLVDEGFMTRVASVYRLRPRDSWPVLPD